MTLALGLAASLVAFAASTQPVAESRKAVSAPAMPKTSGDPEADRILERLEKRGDKVDSLSCTLKSDFLDVVAEDEQSKVGSLLFRRDKPNPKFKVVYDKSIYDGVESIDKHDYYFDGHWLTESHHKSKTGQEREIVAKGENVDLFRIGKGPFPLPFGQKKDEILQHFTVTRIPRSPKDPPKTDHIKLVPHADTEMARKYAEIHFYVSRESDLPMRIVAHQLRPGSKEVDEIVTVTFIDLKINPNIPDDELKIAKPTDKDWHWTRTPLPEEPPPPAER